MRLVMKYSVLFICICFVFCVAALPVSAQRTYEAPLPQVEQLSPQDLENQTDLFEQVPGEDQELAFRMRIPKDWEDRSGFADFGGVFALDNRVFLEAARFYSGARINAARSYLSVDMIELDFVQTAKQWFTQYLSQQGYGVEGFTAHSPQRAEALYVILEKGVSYAVRSVVVINGRKLLMLRYFLPVENWEAEQALQNAVIKSFDIQNPSRAGIKDAGVYQFLDIARIQYPTYWDFEAAPIYSIDRMSADILHTETYGDKFAKKTLNGRIGIDLVSVYALETLEAELADIYVGLSKGGLNLKEPIQQDVFYEFGNHFEFGKVDAYKLADEKGDVLEYEVWVTTMFAGDYYYFVTLLTPGKGGDYQTWLENIQTYKQVLKSIEPLDLQN